MLTRYRFPVCLYGEWTARVERVWRGCKFRALRAFVDAVGFFFFLVGGFECDEGRSGLAIRGRRFAEVRGGSRGGAVGGVKAGPAHFRLFARDDPHKFASM